MKQRKKKLSRTLYIKRKWKEFEKLPCLAFFYQNPPKQKGWKVFKTPSKLRTIQGFHGPQTWAWGNNKVNFDYLKNLPEFCLGIRIDQKWYGPITNTFTSTKEVQIQLGQQFIRPTLKLCHLFKKKYVT
jgi:hypothetical protein